MWLTPRISLVQSSKFTKTTSLNVISNKFCSTIESNLPHDAQKHLLSQLTTNFRNTESPFKQRLPHNYWDNMENQNKFLKYVSQELKIDDFYKIPVRAYVELGGGALLNRYKKSPYLLLSANFPEVEWLPWKFENCPKNLWGDIKNQRKMMEWMENKLGIKDKKEWYKVTKKEFEQFGYGSMLKLYYKGTVPFLLSKVFPEYNWLPWKFERVPKNYWKNEKNVIQFVQWAEKELGIKDVYEWQKITTKDLSSLGGNSLLVLYSIDQILSIVYPEISWNFPNKSAAHKKSQHLLKSMLTVMFPNNEFVEEYKHPDITFASGYPLELDFFYPQLNLAFEYQGIQHFQNVRIFQERTLEEGQVKDVQKSQFCKEKGITLIEIPYWWDRKYHSLAATVYSHRPDYFDQVPMGRPIPTTPNIKETKPPSTHNKVLMTAMEWEESMDPTGLMMTEKYDGMRLYWDGSNFYTRQGKKVAVPEQIKSEMPTNISLDGELWTQYGLYQDASSLCLKGSESEKWNNAIYWVFDTPGMSGTVYEDRIQYLRENKFPSFVKIVETIKCKSKEHLKEYFSQVIAKKGEGIVLRDPQALYKAGRSPGMRKYKPYYDTEVRVLENNYPHGLLCKQVNGKRIFVGLTDNFEEAKKLKQGSVVTVKHSGSNVYGTLQYPKFFRERIDVNWEDLINS